jgi:hypothetical protein
VERAIRPRDDEVTDDEQRGERSREGWSDADDPRKPVQPSEQRGESAPEVTERRQRDPELGTKHA